MPDVREQIYNLISEVDPFDKQEAQDIATINEWIQSDEGIYRDGDQPNEKRHLCCYLALVDLGNEKVLLGKKTIPQMSQSTEVPIPVVDEFSEVREVLQRLTPEWDIEENRFR